MKPPSYSRINTVPLLSAEDEWTQVIYKTNGPLFFFPFLFFFEGDCSVRLGFGLKTDYKDYI